MTTGRNAARLVSLVLATAITMTVLDLLWLGIVARSFYDASLGALKRDPIYWPGAALFYVFYVSAIAGLASVPATDVKNAAKRGALLGLVSYGTYELTNWAVLAGWPAVLVPVDLVWGVVLTAVAAAAGRWVWQRFS